MPKDILGNTVRVGDKVLFNNMLCTVTDIQENRVLGAKSTGKSSAVTLKVPDNMTLEIDVTFDTEKPVNLICVKTPPEVNTAEA